MNKYSIKINKNKVEFILKNKRPYEVNFAEDEYVAKGFISDLIDQHIVEKNKVFSIDLNNEEFITIDQYIKNNKTFLVINELLYKITEILEKVQSAGLDQKKMIFSPKGVLINEKSNQIKIFYIALNEFESKDHYRELFLYIIEKTKITEFNELKRILEQNSTIAVIKELLTDLQVQYINKNHGNSGKGCPNCQKINIYTARFCIYCGTYLNKKKLEIEEEIEEETSLLGEQSGEPITERITKHFVRRESTGEVRIINKNQYHLGKEITNEFVINNNIVSRNHATIILNHDQCYLVDNCSTNYTYVENKRVLPNEQRQLHSGDEFKLGNEMFTYFEKLE